MSWLQLEIRVTPQQLADVETALETAAAITLLSDSDEPVLEPAPGETPIWTSVRLQALLSLDTDLSEVRTTLDGVDPLFMKTADIRFIGEQDWTSQINNYFVDQVFADRLWLLPKPGDTPRKMASSKPSDMPGSLVKLFLEPGLAFGSGSHPTTRMCLEWLAQHVQPGQTVLDFGCGSGILAIAAALLGAKVTAVDHDEQAVVATRDNANYNAVPQDDLVVFSLAQWEQLHDPSSGQAQAGGSEGRWSTIPVEHASVSGYDILIANILAEPLSKLAAHFESLVHAGGAIVLSGVLQSQAEMVRQSYAHTRFSAEVVDNDWVRLDGKKLRVS